uniref:Tumor necrosis factor receptor superfamily member 5-like n=1 Tax=Lepisosteus oculatus TaxID=7918 RepID=W5LVD7_LEPOC
MKIFHIIVVVSLIATVLTCDETTNYMKNGECCKKCEPGTKMKDEFQPCDKPKCDPCGDGEYMPNYNSDTKCKIQPNCDGNLNFIIEDPGSKTEVGKCVCKEGYHCSSEDCVTCAKHTECEVGEGVQRPGTKDRDTECESCLNESFSNITSAVEKCLKWTECTGDSVEIKAGTPTSDRVCGEYDYEPPARMKEYSFANPVFFFRKLVAT